MATVPRFELELEFVQALANVDYVAYLARGEMLDDPEFVAFLEYLCYWTRAEYAVGKPLSIISLCGLASPM
jgi:mediator of RNA polymerase II transcription subunit 31